MKTGAGTSRWQNASAWDRAGGERTLEQDGDAGGDNPWQD